MQPLLPVPSVPLTHHARADPRGKRQEGHRSSSLLRAEKQAPAAKVMDPEQSRAGKQAGFLWGPAGQGGGNARPGSAPHTKASSSTHRARVPREGSQPPPSAKGGVLAAQDSRPQLPPQVAQPGSPSNSLEQGSPFKPQRGSRGLGTLLWLTWRGGVAASLPEAASLQIQPDTETQSFKD